jgi:uncharacterized protein YegL
MTDSTTFRPRLATLLCLLSLLPAALPAQPDLNFKRIRLDWPYVEAYFSVGCNGVKDYSLKASDVRLYEDGREITDFGLWCPDPTTRCPITVGLVFDASDSMTGEGNEGAKEGGATFIGNMDAMVDEACVVHFNQSVWVYQHMTVDTTLLKNAVSLLPASGATALWDAIFTALAIVQNNGRNQCRAVIVLSDGDDNSSTRHGFTDILAFAVRYNIRVFPIGYGENIAEDDLRQLAALTGGVYYQTPNASELAGIYREISTILYDYFQECILSYDPRCGDGESHEVELQIKGVCGGNASMKRSYVAQSDSSSLRTKDFSLGDAAGMGGAEIFMPLSLDTPFANELLYPMSIDLAFDRGALELLRAETPPGTLLAGMNLHIADASNGGRIRIPESRVLDGTGTLCYAVLGTKLHAASAEYGVRVMNAEFDKGCILPQISDGVLRVSASAAQLSCGIQAPPSLTWNGTKHRYEPEPMILRVDLGNNGTLPATNGSVTLEYDASVFDLLEPATPVQLLDTLHALGQAGMQWKLRVKPQANARTGELCVRSNFTGAGELRCCAPVNIPAAGMLLTCDIGLPVVRYVEAARAFTPNPFDLPLQVENPGVVGSGTLRALLQLPEGLYIESGEQYEKILNPSSLLPGQSAAVAWRVRLVSPLGGDRMPVRIELRNDGVLYRRCEDTLVVPWIPPVFEAKVTPSGSTTFCEGDSVRLDAGEGYADYRWNSGQRTRFITVHSDGVYFAAVRDMQGNVGHTNSVRVTVWPRPAKPVVRREFNTLIIDASGTIQWFRDGTALNGETQASLQLQETGRYSVRVVNEYGCGSDSDPFLVNLVAVEPPPGPSAYTLTLYPHPVSAELRVRLHGPANGSTVVLRVFDLLGKCVAEQSAHASTASQQFMLDVSGLRPGLYMLTAMVPDGVLTRKFLRE